MPRDGGNGELTATEMHRSAHVDAGRHGCLVWEVERLQLTNRTPGVQGLEVDEVRG